MEHPTFLWSPTISRGETVKSQKLSKIAVAYVYKKRVHVRAWMSRLKYRKGPSTKRNVNLKSPFAFEMSNDNFCDGSPPSNSNSNFAEMEFGKFETKPSTSVPGETMPKQGAGTLKTHRFSAFFLPNNDRFRGFKTPIVKAHSFHMAFGTHFRFRSWMP